MSSITYTDNVTIIPAAWLNDVNTVAYTLFGDGSNYTGKLTLTKSIALSDTANENIVVLTPTHASFANTVIAINATRAASASYNFLSFNANSVSQFLVTGTGSVTAAGNFTSSTGNVGFIAGTFAARSSTNPTNALTLMDGVAPVGTLSSGIQLYSTSGECRVMDAAGNATLLSPHDHETNEWVYDSVDTRTGRRLHVNMEQLVKFIDSQFGTSFVSDTEV